jgi:hypothetical protein
VRVIVRVVNIGGIVYHHSSNFLFIKHVYTMVKLKRETKCYINDL